MNYYINGWRETEKYFLSFGFTDAELNKMKNGEVIKRGDNEFWIIATC